MEFLNNTYAIVGISLVVVLALVSMVVSAINKKHSVDTKLRRLVADSEQARQEAESQSVMQPQRKSALTTFFEIILQAIGMDIEGQKRKLNLKFAQAGISSEYATVNYLAAKILGLPIALLLVLLMSTWNVEGMMRFAQWILMALAVLAGIWGPDVYLRNEKDKRKEKLLISFPDALDLILVCVESGLALDAALARVCSELERAHPEIAKEFNRTRMELTLLNSREKALQNLGERTDLMPFRALIASLLQSERFGTSLVDTLRVLSEDYRTTRLMIAENKAGKLPALITIPLIVCMLPALMLVLMGPAIISIVENFFS